MEFLDAGPIDAWADLVAGRVLERLTANPGLRLCLPTGLTPVPVYDRLAAAVAAGTASFARAEVFLLDEFGGVAPDNPGRCDQMLRHAFVSRIDLPEARFHRFTLDADVAEECRRYEALVGEGCDLALLGIGTNGHLGMNEPGSAADAPTRRVDLAPSTIAASARYFGRSTDLPTWGVTMGLGTLARSREIWILATGAGKAPIVRDTLRGPVSTAVPSTLLRDHPATTLIADEEAGSLVRTSRQARPC
jgi:glucosamine-6-phosphate deaminase